MKIIERPSRELWSQVVARSPYATFFHTPTWADILVSAFPEMRIATKAFCLDENTVAIVPLIGTIERNGFFGWFESMYPGAYGGPVAERPLKPSEMKAIAHHLKSRHTAFLHIMGNPFLGSEKDFHVTEEFAPSLQYTHFLYLEDGFDAVHERFSPEKRRYARKAVKLGVVVRVAETWEEYEQYYQAYLDTLERWGESTLVRYPRSLFEHLFRRRSDAIRLWVAKVNGQVISGKLVFYHQRQALYWHGATVQRYFDHHPGPLLMREIVQDACQQGLQHLDLGPSGGLAGVEYYKETFGAQKRFFGSYVWNTNPLYRLYQRLRRLGRRAVSKTAA